MNGLKLRELGLGAKLGLTFALLTLIGGFAASAAHLEEHHENRDAKPGVSKEDLLGAYHGVDVTSPLLTSLEGGHPEGLAANERELLLGWLRGTRISEDYDNLDLGSAAPAEALDKNCLSCHSRQSTEGDGIGQTVPLDYWDDVEKIAFSRNLEPTAIEILIASTHTHAISLALVAIVIGALLLATRWPSWLRHGLAASAGIALFADLACWWLVRSSPGLLMVLILAGVAYAASTVLSALLVIADLWLPSRR